MTINDAPMPADLPEKVRVHALAKLLGRTSREVIAYLNELGVEVRSAQSGVDRKSAEQVLMALAGDAPVTARGDEGPVDDLAPPAPEVVPPARTARAPRAARAPRVEIAPASPIAPAPDAEPVPDPARTSDDGADLDAGSAAAPEGGPVEGADAPKVTGRTRTRRTAGTGRARRAAGPVDSASDAAPPAAGPPAADPVEAAAAAAFPDSSGPNAAVTTDPGTTDPGTTDPGTTDPGTTDSADTDLSGGTDLSGVTDILDIAAAAAPPRRSRRAPAAPLSPVFAPPAPLFQPPERSSGSRRTADPVGEESADLPAEEAPAPRRRRRSRAADDAPAIEDTPAQAPLADPVEEAHSEEDLDADGPDTDDDESGDSARRRRRRGRRGRGRGRGADDEDAALPTAEDDAVGGGPTVTEPADLEAEDDGESEDEEESDDDSESGTSRRRRRRRRRRGAGEDEPTRGDDPPSTVVRIRPPREAREVREDDGDGVQGVRGSTRLEAKRQRRRDGRDAGRRRQPVLSEAEFLARRESVERTMVVRERRDRVEIGVLEDDILVEHFVTDGARDGAGKSLVGNIYLGRVQNVLPSMEAAFVDIGRGRNAVLYAGEVDWDAAGLGGKARRIEQALSSGDPVLVQVTKDPLGHKGARLTTQISLAGRFLVYVPSGGAAGISRKLPDVERKRLKDMLRELVPSEAGVIIRTASEGVSHEALERDVRRLQAQWEVVKERSEKTGPEKPKAPVLLYEEPDLLIKVVRDQFNEDFSRLVVQGDDAFETLHGYISHVAPELAARMHRHAGTEDVFAAHRIDEQLLKALDRKVWLPSGGTLVIDRTEAMTVVDVNTGKYTGSGGNLEETVTRNNLEAAEEIVRQMRLRDIGGIIVVDFIDMVLEANRDLVLRRLTECLARDRTRHQVAEVTSLGLVQMTRKRVGGGLLEHFSHPCEHCRGRGVVVDVDLPDQPDDHRDRATELRVADIGGGRRSRGGRGRRGESDGNGSTSENAPETDGSGLGRSGGNGHAGDADPGAGSAASGNGRATAGSDGIALVRNGRNGRAEPVVLPDTPDLTGATGAPAVDAVANGVGAAATRGGPSSAGEVPDGEVAVPEVAVPEVVTPEAEAAPRPRRRGRVTRTAGAPSAPAGDAPSAAIVTIGAATVDTDGAAGAAAPEEAPAPVEAPAPEPEPVATARPRRARRTASRPAGPPVEGSGDPS